MRKLDDDDMWAWTERDLAANICRELGLRPMPRYVCGDDSAWIEQSTPAGLILPHSPPYSARHWCQLPQSERVYGPVPHTIPHVVTVSWPTHSSERALLHGEKVPLCPEGWGWCVSAREGEHSQSALARERNRIVAGGGRLYTVRATRGA